MTIISFTNWLTAGENDDNVVISAKQPYISKTVIKKKSRVVQNTLQIIYIMIISFYKIFISYRKEKNVK